jgi:hypothetical protein
MIVDGCLPQKVFDSFVNQVTDKSVPWYFTEYTAFLDKEKKNDLFEGSWAHVIIMNGENNSSLAPICRQIINLILFSLGQELDSLTRVRLGLITRTETRVVHDAHVDYYDEPHKTTLLYLNDSDGDTLLYNKFHKTGQDVIKCSSDDIIENVTPKANRIVSFDGWQYHSSSTPILNNYRIVMNINYTIK